MEIRDNLGNNRSIDSENSFTEVRAMKGQVHIHVNDEKITLDKENITGREIKQIVGILESERLYLEVENASDIEILNDNTYEIRNGMKFFSGLFCRKIKVDIDHTKYDLQKSDCTGLELKGIANIPTTFKLVKETQNGDIPIEDNLIYHFEKGNIIFSVPDGISNGSDEELLLFDKKVLEDDGYKYEMRQYSEGKMLIINDYNLSPMFDQEEIRVLIKIPKGYPMAPLDMFWVNPYVKLKGTNDYPQNANTFEVIEGETEKWQRFSRHYPWKSTYNLGTHLAVVKDVLVNGRG